MLVRSICVYNAHPTQKWEGAFSSQVTYSGKNEDNTYVIGEDVCVPKHLNWDTHSIPAFKSDKQVVLYYKV